MKALTTWVTLTMLALPGLAQRDRDVISITPRITGGDSSSGKCIVRLMVDDTVNVRLGNGQIRVETVAGRSSRDDGSECTSVLQNGRNLSDFQFRGVDGRGEVRLQSDPRQNPRGEAVIYIRDTKGGEEGYTFEVTWQGDDGRGSGGRGIRGNGSGGRGGFFSGGGTSTGQDNALNSCLDRVREEASREFGVTNLVFDNVNATNQSGPRDRITGTARAGNRDRYRYECQVNLNNGNVRNVNVRRQ